MSEVDALEIRIRDNSEQAAKGIDRLAESVGKIAGINKDAFKGVFTGIYNIQLQAASAAAVVNYLNKTLNELKGIKSVKLFTGNFGQTLADLRNISPLLSWASYVGNQLDTSLQHISQYNLSTLVDQLNKLTPLANTASGLGETLKPVGDLLGSLGRDTSEGNLQMLGGQIGAIRQQLEPISGLIGDISAALSDMSEEKGGAKAFNNMSNALDKFGKFMTGFDYNSEMETYSDVMAFIEDMSNTYAILEKETGNFAGFQGLQQQFGGFVESLTGLQTFLKKFNGDKLEENFGKVMSTMERVNTQMVTLGEQNGGWAGFGQLETICQNVAHSISLVADELERINNAGGCEILDRVMSSVALSSAETAQQTEEIKQNVRESGFNVKELEKGFAKAFNHATKFADMMWRMLKRNIIRKIFEGFSTGVSNLYAWSAALNDNGAFKSVMDNYSTALNTLVNAVGSAAGALLNALYPAFVTVANIIVTAVNALNQFISALTGSTTWNRPNDIATAFDDTAKNAKNASKSTKELLADWDELNVITSKSGSGGSSGGTNITVDNNALFTVTDISDKIKGITDWIKSWPGLVDAAFAGLITWIATKNLGVGTLVFGAVIGFEGVTDAIAKEDITLQNLNSMIASAIATAAGITMMTGGGWLIGVSVGLLVFFGELFYTEDQIAKKKIIKAFGENGKGGMKVQQLLDEAQAKVDEYTASHQLVITAYAKFTEQIGDVETAKSKVQELYTEIFGSDSQPTKEQIDALKTAWEEFDKAITTSNSLSSDVVLAGLDTILNNKYSDLHAWAIKFSNEFKVINGQLSASQAEIANNRDMLQAKILNGTATDEEIAAYGRIVSQFGLSDSAVITTQQWESGQSNATKIDFSEADDAVKAAQEFIDQYSALYAQMLGLNKQAETAQLEALNTLKADVIRRMGIDVKWGGLSQENGEALLAMIQEGIANFKQESSSEASRLAGELSSVFTLLFNQAWAEYDGDQRQLESVINPIFNAITGNGNIPEQVKRTIRDLYTNMLNQALSDSIEKAGQGFTHVVGSVFDFFLGWINPNGSVTNIPVDVVVTPEVQVAPVTDVDGVIDMTEVEAALGVSRDGTLHLQDGIMVEAPVIFNVDPSSTQKYNYGSNASLVTDFSGVSNVINWITGSSSHTPSAASASSHFGASDSATATEDTANAVESGVASMNSSLGKKLDDLITALNSKDFSITINPTSALGRVATRAMQVYSQTTGE